MHKHKQPENNATLISRLSFYATPEHECSYLPERSTITLFADPGAQLNNKIYSTLAEYGFRRSGKHIYRPACPLCSACIPVRILVQDFKPRRTQRRIWKRNQDLAIHACASEYNEEHHALYRKYMDNRHKDGSMDEADPEKYMEFLTSDWSATRFMEFRLGQKLVAVAVMDELERGLSAVYTFFDPDYVTRSPGVYSILWEIEYARNMNAPYLYLGYWIEECSKMSYKSQYQPLEMFQEGKWLIL